MVRAKKKVPGFIKNEFLIYILKSNPAIFISHWIFQGCLYSDRRETTFKLMITVILSGLLMFVMHPLLAIIVAHSVNFLFNAHFPQMLVKMGIVEKSPRSFLQYIEKFRKRVGHDKPVIASYAYGSLSRGNYKSTSDFDVRLIPAQGKWLPCLFILVRERTCALFHLFPIDIYVSDYKQLKYKILDDEQPICIKEGQQPYPGLQPIGFSAFEERFAERNFKENE